MKIINVTAVLKPVQRRQRLPAQGAEDAAAQKTLRTKSRRRLAVGVSAAAPLPASAGNSLAADVQAAALARQKMNFSGIMMIQCWCSPVICWRKKKINNNYISLFIFPFFHTGQIPQPPSEKLAQIHK